MPEDWDGIISRKINRKFSRPISNFLAKHRFLTPNQVTFLSFLIALSSPLLFLYKYPLFAGLLAQISSIVDGVDGELARLMRKKSSFGAFFDSTLDRYADVAIILGMVYYSLFFENFSLAFSFGIFAIVGAVLVSYTSAAANLAFKKKYNRYKEGIIAYAASRDARLFIVFIGSLFTLFYSQAITVTLIVLAVLTNFIVILRIMFYKSKFSSPTLV